MLDKLLHTHKTISIICYITQSQDIYQRSELTSIKVGNDSRRNTFYGGQKNLTRDQDMAINLVVHIGNFCHLCVLSNKYIILLTYKCILSDNNESPFQFFSG